jgi:hypothetical protein
MFTNSPSEQTLAITLQHNPQLCWNVTTEHSESIPMAVTWGSMLSGMASINYLKWWDLEQGMHTEGRRVLLDCGKLAFAVSTSHLASTWPGLRGEGSGTDRLGAQGSGSIGCMCKFCTECCVDGSLGVTGISKFWGADTATGAAARRSWV